MKKIAKIVATLLVGVMVLSLAACADKKAESAETQGTSEGEVITNASTITKTTLFEKQVDFYDPDGKVIGKKTLYFKEKDNGVPYITLDQAKEILQYVRHEEDEKGASHDIDINVISDGDYVIWERTNNCHVCFDFGRNAINFTNYDAFVRDSYANVNPLDIVESPDYTGEGSSGLFKRINASYYRKGTANEINLGEYQISLMFINGTGYIPVQTFNDIFICPTLFNLVYNGENLFLVTGVKDNKGNLNEVGKLYYSVTPSKRSEELVEFNYYELCLALDLHYGLKSEHRIDKFDKFFMDAELFSDLYSEDAYDSTVALVKLFMMYFADMHSGFDASSPYAGDVSRDSILNDPKNAGLASNGVAAYGDISDRYLAARKEVTGKEGCVGYEEVGNTAYVTFDEFSMDLTTNYRTIELKNSAEDTLNLIMYAHEQITRENSPIENVVIDLSNNGGGACDAAAAVTAWFCGIGQVSVQSTVTGGQSINYYLFDTNRDGVFDEKDSLDGAYNLFCITSPSSFSCGNLVPSVFKYSDCVTLIGHATRGGACAVQPLSSADGSLFQISSRLKFSYVINGAYYSIDEGIEPDFYIANIDMLYDRNQLTDYINGIK